MDCGDEVGQWISDVLQRPGCRLIRQDKTQARTCKLSGKQWLRRLRKTSSTMIK